MDPQPNRPNGLSIPPSAPLGKSQEFFSCSYPDCDYKSNWEENVGRHERNHSPTGLDCHIPCQVCPQVFPYLVSYLHHMTSNHSTKLFCPCCLFLGQDLTEFKAHMIAHILKARKTIGPEAVNFCTAPAEKIQAGNGSQDLSENSAGSAPQISLKNVEGFKAGRPKSNRRRSTPKKSLATWDTAVNEGGEAQKRASTEIDWRCGNCALTFASKGNLGTHEKTICRSALLLCDKCSYETSFAEDLRKHMKIHLAGKQLKCQNLGCYYKTLWTKRLRKHQLSCKIRIPASKTSDGISKSIEILMKEVKMDEGGSEYSCSFCSFKSKSRLVLKRHFMTHVGRKTFRCGRKGCEYEVKLPQTLRNHIRRIHPRKAPKAKENLVCNMECESSDGASAKRPNELIQKGFVPGGTLFTCSICGHKFKTKGNLKSHLMTHTDLKPYACPIRGCKYRSKWSQHVKQHARFVHGVDLPRQMKLRFKENLVVHNDDHQPFRCPIQGCKYRTKRSSELRKHFRILHHIQLTQKPKKAPLQTEKNLGSDREMKIEGFVRSSTTAFACVLCEFIGYSPLSALKHSCEHKTAVISLNRIEVSVSSL